MLYVSSWPTARIDELRQAVDDCPQPILVVAESSSPPGTDVQLQQLLAIASSSAARLKVVLLLAPGAVRNDLLGPVPVSADDVLLLTVVGDSDDWMRWYGEAVRAYAGQLVGRPSAGAQERCPPFLCRNGSTWGVLQAIAWLAAQRDVPLDDDIKLVLTALAEQWMGQLLTSSRREDTADALAGVDVELAVRAAAWALTLCPESEEQWLETLRCVADLRTTDDLQLRLLTRRLQPWLDAPEWREVPLLIAAVVGSGLTQPYPPRQVDLPTWANRVSAVGRVAEAAVFWPALRLFLLDMVMSVAVQELAPTVALALARPIWPGCWTPCWPSAWMPLLPSTRRACPKGTRDSPTTTPRGGAPPRGGRGSGMSRRPAQHLPPTSQPA